MNAKRIVSLLPSATEIVALLGAGDALVGRSHECDFPVAVRSLPVCTKARLNSAADSAKIDQDVKELLAQALSIYDVDMPQLERLKPDVIVTQDQCDVCAVSRSQVEQLLGENLAGAVAVVSLTALDLEGVWRDIQRAALALGVDGSRAVTGLQSRLRAISDRTSEIAERPSVACIEWTAPVMVAGNWVPELVKIAGGNDALGRAGEHSPYIEWADLETADPDVIVAMPCGFDLARTRSEMAPLVALPGWGDLSAVKNGRVFVTDGNQYFNRPGPRLVESAEILGEIIHPDAFDFGHRGIGWEVY